MPEQVILIPGLMCDARLFLHQIIHLSQTRLVAVFMPLPEATVEALSERLLEGAPERFALVGHGLGGAVALDVLRRAPERVTRIALLATDPLAEAPQIAAAREARMVAARAGRLAQAIADEVPAAALADNPWRDSIMELQADMALRLGEAVYLAQSRAMQRRPDHQKTLRRVMLPALILAGRRDMVVPLRRQDFASALMPYGRLQIVEDAGHLAPLEQPEAVTEALEGFLNGPAVTAMRPV